MAVDPLNVWKQTLNNLPKVKDTSWAKNFANWYADRIVGITTDPTKLDVTTGFTFTFQKSTFEAALLALGPTSDPLSGIKKFADAWQSAISTSVVVVAPGAFKPPTSPATLFSVVATSLIDPPSILTGYAKILELAKAPPVANGLDSQFPIKFREATLLLTISVTGTDSTPTPAGPLPLAALLVPLI